MFEYDETCIFCASLSVCQKPEPSATFSLRTSSLCEVWRVVPSLSLESSALPAVTPGPETRPGSRCLLPAHCPPWTEPLLILAAPTD